jgi:hypothetical protein
MMMTTRSKFGTRAWGVAVGIGEGVNVGRTGVEVNVGEGIVDGITVGGGDVVQEINKMKKRIHRPKRCI